MHKATLMVKEFYEAAKGEAPKKPLLLRKDQVDYTIRNVIGELYELASTVHEDPKKAIFRLCEEAKLPKENYVESDDNTKRAEQYDAFVDVIYYVMCSAAEYGCNLAPLFKEIHVSNMSKGDDDGTFHTGPFGVIIKSKNYKPPRVKEMVAYMLENDNNWELDEIHLDNKEE
jgi:predicted HAD superfamily Cof-like phosphohydrolase